MSTRRSHIITCRKTISSASLCKHARRVKIPSTHAQEHRHASVMPKIGTTNPMRQNNRKQLYWISNPNPVRKYWVRNPLATGLNTHEKRLELFVPHPIYISLPSRWSHYLRRSSHANKQRWNSKAKKVVSISNTCEMRSSTVCGAVRSTTKPTIIVTTS